MRFLRTLRTVVLFGLFLFILNSCIFERKVSKAQRKAYKQEEALQRASDDEYEQRVRQHYDKQSKATQKSMKRLQKRSDKLMKSRYRPWYRSRI